MRVLGWMENIEDEWPALKYLGFGCYYAWIFLCYSGDVLFSEAGLINGVSAQTVMYLLSTTALAVTLLTAAVFHKHVAKLVARARVVVGGPSWRLWQRAWLRGRSRLPRTRRSGRAAR